jgi:hypothetical protein
MGVCHDSKRRSELDMLGKRVRLLRNTVFNKLLSPHLEWTGVIVEEWTSKHGSPTHYLVRFDESLQHRLSPLSGETYVYEQEFELLD